jgi:hypothetical protein
MPIELLHTDSELLKIRTNLLKKMLLSKEDLKTLREINAHFNRVV